MSEPLIIFLHIPRTGGTTLNKMLLDQYERDQIAFLHDDPEWSLERLIHVCNSEQNTIKVISGHFPFGIHEFIARPCTYVTFLRHPIDLILSTYYFILKHNPDRIAHLNFQQFIESTEWNFATSNVQTKFLYGMQRQHELSLSVEYSLWNHFTPDVKQAQEHLRNHFAVVGVTDRFKEGVRRLSKILRWTTPIQLYVENTTDNRPSRSSLDASTMQLLFEKNELDFQLYEFAESLFRKQKGWSPSFSLTKSKSSLPFAWRRL
ncbi:sulfotransferase family 2 domain-containing protein [Paenibacillus sp. 481]|uniref:sulfotransferase family 2 domain-containing protein n=1 Tax=Paenibacillus sp. 481 TaxID=2835869 RepID=UPI001E5A409C|nr:sulfotransferase family 2 domain-containing protein [Paenibacillus sp. 481]UHA73551.1 sulfotransferase family 2 domain-containing protein [Paenibacillus sp. 481]